MDKKKLFFDFLALTAGTAFVVYLGVIISMTPLPRLVNFLISGGMLGMICK